MHLPKNKLKSISIGYIWSPDMSYEEFCEKNDLNPRNCSSEGYDMFNKINDRYQTYLDESI